MQFQKYSFNIMNSNSLKKEKFVLKKSHKTPLSLWILEYHRFIQEKMEWKIELMAKSSAKEISIKWKIPPNLPAPIDQFTINLTIILTEFEGGHIFPPMGNSNCFGIPKSFVSIPVKINSIGFNAIPGSQYSILLDLIWNEKNVILSQNAITTRATFSMSEMELLYKKAFSFIGNLPMHPFNNFFRSKPKNYWDKICSTSGKIMQIYPKDSNGQAASPINQNIQGIFFNAFSSMPNESSVGDQLLTIPALDLLEIGRNNLYFADFYCNRQNSKHYVTIVATKNESEIDKFCQSNLIRLDPFDNPFLKFRQTTPDSPEPGLLKLDSSKSVWLEMFYTENIPIGKYIENIRSICPQGNGISLPRGVPHFQNCQICNIHL